MKDKPQREFMQLNNQQLWTKFADYLEEFKYRWEWGLPNKIPSQTKESLIKKLKKYPRQDGKCFFCQKTKKSDPRDELADQLFFLDYADFWACYTCYDKYTKLKQLQATIKWDVQQVQQNFPLGYHCGNWEREDGTIEECPNGGGNDCCNSCSCSNCPPLKEKLKGRSLTNHPKYLPQLRKCKVCGRMEEDMEHHEYSETRDELGNWDNQIICRKCIPASTTKAKTKLGRKPKRRSNV